MKVNKKIKLNENSKNSVDFEKLFKAVLNANDNMNENPFEPLLEAHRRKKNPILQVVNSRQDIFKTTSERKKKPIETYLDTVTTLYKKQDLDLLINPVCPCFAFEKWSPRQIAIFEQSIVKFGKQFEFIAQLIGTKNCKDTYQFYLQWKNTSHYKSYKTYLTALNRTNIEDIV